MCCYYCIIVYMLSKQQHTTSTLLNISANNGANTMLAQVTYNDIDLNALVISEYVDEDDYGNKYVYYTVELYDRYDTDKRMNDIEAMIEANDDSYIIDEQINEWIKDEQLHSY